MCASTRKHALILIKIKKYFKKNTSAKNENFYFMNFDISLFEFEVQNPYTYVRGSEF